MALWRTLQRRIETREGSGISAVSMQYLNLSFIYIVFKFLFDVLCKLYDLRLYKVRKHFKMSHIPNERTIRSFGLTVTHLKFTKWSDDMYSVYTQKFIYNLKENIFLCMYLVRFFVKLLQIKMWVIDGSSPISIPNRTILLNSSIQIKYRFCL